MHDCARCRGVELAIGYSAGEKLILGIESTAHTFSMGIADSNGDPWPSISVAVRPEEGGIHPREAADHHAERAGEVLAELLRTQELEPGNFGAIAFSQGPGLGPCLRIGASVARTISQNWSIPLVGVNHCVAHIEVGRQQCDCDDPVLLYVSGGNTQVISRLGNRYRVLGETLDIGIGNLLDKFAREQGMPFPGGPEIERLAGGWVASNPTPTLDGLELPYAVQGMDLAFSGILNAALGLVAKGAPLEAVCWSLQEHAFAASVEVAERALAHTGKTELLLGGGVACNERLRDMCDIMAKERGASSHVPERRFCVDNGSMIAVLGRLHLLNGESTPIENSAVNQYLRTDQTVIVWA